MLSLLGILGRARKKRADQQSGKTRKHDASVRSEKVDKGKKNAKGHSQPASEEKRGR